MLDSVLLTYALLFAGLSEAPGMGQLVESRTKSETLISAEPPKLERLFLYTSADPAKEPKISPKGEWTFPFLTAAYGRDRIDKSFSHRFRVFSQDLDDAIRVGEPSARMLIRMWDLLRMRLKRDHSPAYYERLVDVYLAKEGVAGGEQVTTEDRNHTGMAGSMPKSRGEQLFDLDPMLTDSAGNLARVNNIYIYQIAGFKEPMEMAREIAHEYGHAVLPPVGGYSEPENWANGDLGERLFLKWLRGSMGPGGLNPVDVMKATSTQIDAYLARSVTPLVKSTLLNGPDLAKLKLRNRAGFDHYLGVILAAEEILPLPVFTRALYVPAADQKAEAYFDGIVEAASEKSELPITVPNFVSGSPIWIPLGKGKLAGGKILARRGGWAKVQPSAKIMMIKNPPLEP